MNLASNKQSPMISFEDHRKPDRNGAIGITIVEERFQGFLNLRFDSSNTDCLAAVKQIYGVDVPSEANMFSTTDNAVVYWLGPDEWLVKLKSEDEVQTSEFLEVVGDNHCAATDLSSGTTLLRLSGPSVENVLRQGITFDIHPRAFKFGSCAQTVFAHANVLLVRSSENTDELEMIMRRSFAEHIMLFLLNAAADYGYELRC